MSETAETIANQVDPKTAQVREARSKKLKISDFNSVIDYLSNIRLQLKHTFKSKY